MKELGRMEHEQRTIKSESGLLWTWWRGDPLPLLEPLSNLTVATPTDLTLIAQLLETPVDYVIQRMQDNHRPYVAYMNNTPVAVGWSARDQAEFAEGLVRFRIPAKNRYCYFFLTWPAWRNRGIYTHLLQTILHIESRENERFWILHEIGNTPSARGIAKAGFHLTSKFCLLSDDTPCFVPVDTGIQQRAHAGAAVFGLPLYALDKSNHLML